MAAIKIHCNARLVVGDRVVRGMVQRLSGKWLYVDCAEHVKAGQPCDAILMPRLSLGTDEPMKARCIVRSVVIASDCCRLVLEAMEFLGDGWKCLERGTQG